MMLRHRPAEFITHPGFSVGVLLTTPPFPYTRKQVAEPTGLPILFEGALDEEDHRDLHFGEIGLADGAPVTSGLYRSEEHTSELQSLMRNSYAVFCLKKKK